MPHKRLNLPAAMLAVAGVVHLVVAPEHFTHAPAHGIYFGVAGLMELGWAIEFRHNLSRAMLQVGIALAGGLFLLWALTQVVGAPFITGAEPVDWSTIVCKVCEGIAVAALARIILRGAFADDISRLSPDRILGESVGLALAVCLVSYAGGRLAERVAPQLGELPGHQHASGTAPLNFALSHNILVTGAWIRPPGISGGNASAFMTLINFSQDEDVLLEVTTDIAPRARFDQTLTLAGDVSQTTVQDELPVPASGRLALEPGRYEIALIGVSQLLAAGQVVRLSLRFKQAGQIEVNAQVVALPTVATPAGVP